MNRTARLDFSSLLQQASFRRGAIMGSILLVALLAFEIFNFSTTDFALTDLLGANLQFLGIRWATVLSIAFCGMDFAGIARIFTPEQGADEPVEVWYLFGAWLLAASMNALLTWWGVAIAVNTHQVAGTVAVSSKTVQTLVPIFVAALVWLIRIMLIGSFSVAGDRLFSMAAQGTPVRNTRQTTRGVQQTGTRSSTYRQPAQTRPLAASSASSAAAGRSSGSASRPEPTYHPVGMGAAPENTPGGTWR